MLSRIKEQVLNAFIFSCALCLFLSVAYAAISWPTTPAGETAGGKFASVLNTILNSGDWKNPWDGKVKNAASADVATKLNATGQYMSVYLAGSAMPWNSTIWAWNNVGTKGHTWNLLVNTDASNFTHDGNGNVTVKETGLYEIREVGMFMPSTDFNDVGYFCPFINGGIYSCPYGMNSHDYYKAGFWYNKTTSTFIVLPANAVVSYGYFPNTTLTYWWHGWYTSLSLIRVR